MYAHVGDTLVVDSEPPRTGLIIAIPRGGGAPPYVVKWLDGHIAMVSPGQFARVIPADRPAPAGSAPASPAPAGPVPEDPGQPDA